MPTYEITTTDGKKYRVTDPGAQQMPAGPSAWEGFKQGQADMAEGSWEFARRGMLNAFPAASRALSMVAFGNMTGRDPKMEAQLAKSKADYEAQRKASGATGFDWARIAGQATSPSNAIASAAGVPDAPGALASSISGMIGGAVGGALQPAGTNEQTTANATLGAIGGGIAAPVFNKFGEVANSAYRKITGSGAATADDVQRAVASALSEQGIDPGSVSKAAMLRMRGQVEFALKNGKKLDPASMVRQADFESLGTQGTLGQITRDPMQYARERDMRGIWGVGDKMTQRMQQQREALAGHLMPGEVIDNASAGDRVIGSLSSLADKARGHFGALYDQARQQTGAEAGVNTTGLADDFGKVLRKYGEENIPSAVRKNLESYGILGGKQTKLFTLIDAEQAIQQINALYDPSKRAERAALDEVRNAIKRAVAESPVGDAFKPARDAAAQWYKAVDATPALKAVVEDKISPDDFVRKFVINGKRDDLKALASALSGDAESTGAIRSKIIEHLQSAAFGPNPAGDAPFSPSRYKTAIDKIAPKLGAFFSPDEIAQLKTVGRVGGYVNSVPNASAPNFSNTSTALANRAFDVFGALSRIPGARVLSGNIAGSRALSPDLPSAPMLTAPMQRISGGIGAAGVPMIVGGSGTDNRSSDPGILATGTTLAELLKRGKH